MPKGDLTWIKSHLRREGLSIRKLAKKLGTDPSYLSKQINSDQPSLNTYFDIAKGTKLPLSVVLSRSGIIPPIDPETSEIITILGKLDPDTKKEVLEFAKFKEQTQKTP